MNAYKIRVPTLLLMLLFATAGCVLQATPEELAKCHHGRYPKDYDAAIKGYMSSRLLDPESARYTLVAEPHKGYMGFLEGGGPNCGWIVIENINAKNRFGGYTGASQYQFLFKNDWIDRAIGEGL